MGPMLIDTSAPTGSSVSRQLPLSETSLGSLGPVVWHGRKVNIQMPAGYLYKCS